MYQAIINLKQKQVYMQQQLAALNDQYNYLKLSKSERQFEEFTYSIQQLLQRMDNIEA